MVSWRDQILPASWRGIEFLVQSADGEFGRRIAFDEVGERVVDDDLGRRRRRFRLTGIVLGDDYIGRRDELIAACERSGPGELVHPWRGPMQVRCERVSVTERHDRMGGCEISFDFVEVGRLGLRTTQDPATSVEDASDEVQLQTLTVVAERDADLASGPSYLLSEAGSERLRASIALAAEISRVPSIIDASGDAAAQLRALILEDADPRRLLRLARLAVPIPPGLDPRVEAAVVADIVRAQADAAGRAARLSVDETFATADDAERRRDRILEAISSLLERVDDPTLWSSVSDMRSAASQALSTLAEDLPRLRTITVTSVPALVLAFDLYGDPTRDEEIIERNAVAWPGSVSGEIEVLSE